VLVVTRTKNRPLLLKRALQSVQRQTFVNFMHVIVNDGGNKVEVDTLISELNDPRVVAIHHEKSLGMEAASNTGLKYTVASYAVIHDDDDSWETNFLERSVTYLDVHHELSGVVCNIRQCFERDNIGIIEPISSRLFNPSVKQFHLNDFLVVNQFLPIAFLYRYCLHEKIGFYDEAFKVCGDLDFFIRVLKKHKIGKISACLARYHVRVNKVSNTMSNSVSSIELHKCFSDVILKRYDKRSIIVKLYTWIRVKYFYRSLNICMRFMDKLRVYE